MAKKWIYPTTSFPFLTFFPKIIPSFWKNLSEIRKKNGFLSQLEGVREKVFRLLLNIHKQRMFLH